MKRCEDCIYFRGYCHIGEKEFSTCKLTNIILKKQTAETCNLYNVNLAKEDICYNCKYFLGGGDWGLACSKYYHRLPEALDKMCEDGEFKI